MACEAPGWAIVALGTLALVACASKADPGAALDTGVAPAVPASTDTAGLYHDSGVAPLDTEGSNTTGMTLPDTADTYSTGIVDNEDTQCPEPTGPSETGLSACPPLPVGVAAVLDLDVDLPFAIVKGDYPTGAFSLQAELVGDVNGDGWGDLLVSAPWEVTAADTGDTSCCPENDIGAMYLVYGPVAGEQSASDVSVRVINDPALHNGWMWTPGDVGDLDGDGLSEVAFRGGEYVYGEISVFFGMPGAAGETVLAQSAEVILRQYEETYDHYHQANWIEGGDLDADGQRDIVTTMWLTIPSLVDGHFEFPGYPVDIWSIRASDGILDAANPTIRIVMPEGVIMNGLTNGVGDVNGDGVTDLAMGASSDELSPYFDPAHVTATITAGSVRVIYGPLAQGMTLADFDAVVWGLKGEDIGEDVEIPGDLDGDGRSDITFGGERHFGEVFEPGAVYVFTADLWAEQLTERSWARLDGYENEEVHHPDDGVDLDVDGEVDLLAAIAHPFWDLYGDPYWKGGAYIKLGPIPCGIGPFRDAADLLVLPDADGFDIEAGTDWSGDGMPDLFVNNFIMAYGWVSVTTLPL